jgi:hypothetical protein
MSEDSLPPVKASSLPSTSWVRRSHFGVAIGGVIFGAIHIAAWNFDFPTSIERTLWRIASVLSTALLPVMYLSLEYFVQISPLLIKIWAEWIGGANSSASSGLGEFACGVRSTSHTNRFTVASHGCASHRHASRGYASHRRGPGHHFARAWK